MTDLQSKTIRTILQKLDPCMCSFKDGFAYDSTKPCHCGAKDRIDLALSDISKIIDEEVIGDMEYRETEDMSLKTWSAEDLKAFGRNELRNEQREKLNEVLR